MAHWRRNRGLTPEDELGREDVAPLGQGPQQAVPILFERTSDLRYALGEAVVGDENARPNDVHQLIPREEPTGVPNEVVQQVEALGAELQLSALSVADTALGNVKAVAVESKQDVVAHSALQPHMILTDIDAPISEKFRQSFASPSGLFMSDRLHSSAFVAVGPQTPAAPPNRGQTDEAPPR